jgi:hypothetical protein
VVTEVLHPKTLKPIQRGVGELVVTTLHPFVQAMPLIRYRTGDLVELGPRCATAGERGFRFRGRLAQCLLDAKGNLRLSPQDVEAALDLFPEVARLAHPLVELGVVKSPDVGVPRFELQPDRVRVEVRYEPVVFEAHARALQRSLQKTLKFPIEAVRPGTLTRRWTKF